MIEQVQQFKVCKQCGESKVLEEFYKCKKTEGGRVPRCSSCSRANYSVSEKRIKDKARYVKNFDKNKEASRKRAEEWRKNNKDRVIKNSKLYYENNKEICLTKVKEYKNKNKKRYKEYYRRYQVENKEKINLSKLKWEKERGKDPVFRLNKSISAGIRGSLNGKKKYHGWRKLVKYTLEELKSHLESLFSPNMNWQNYGSTGWHIDHITPVCSFNIKEAGDEEFEKCWSLNNLRPLWATTAIAMTYGEDETYIGNLNKGGKIING